MKLSQLYTNRSSFKNIKFNLNGLNVIYADVTTQLDETKNSHNLGKSLLIELIDFLLMKSISPKDHFFYTATDSQGEQVFEDYIFYLELLLDSGKYLTIRRAVEQSSKASFKINLERTQNFTPPLDWDFENKPFKTSKELLANYLSFPFFRDKSYDFRKSITYTMRGQRDYADIYRLTKFKGKDINWKPFIFDFLGFNGKLLENKYETESIIKEKEDYAKKITHEFSVQVKERDEIIAQINLKKKKLSSIEDKLDKFNFYEKDQELIALGVDDIEVQISNLNALAYKLEYEISNLNKSIKNKFSFDLKKIEQLFKESELSFPEQLKKEYSDLLSFNHKLTKERNSLLRKTLANKQEKLDSVRATLKSLNDEKENLLSFLQDTSTFQKFKSSQKDLVKLEADFQVLKNKLDIINKLSTIEEQVKDLNKDINKFVDEIKKELSETETNNHYNLIRDYFAEFYKEILGEDAYFSLSLNSQNNVEFKAPEILNESSKRATSQGKGYTYSKLFCVCFDLAILVAYNNQAYFKYVYHDDVLANEDDGVKTRLITLIKDICKKFDLQYILSTIKSDLPVDYLDNIIYFSDEEIILNLHDRNDSGTLFNTKF